MFFEWKKLLLSTLTALIVLTGISASTFAQGIVKGKVTDKAGNPLIGATVLLKRLNEGVITDANGNFTLTIKKAISKNDILLFRYVGYKNAELRYTDAPIKMVMEEDAHTIDELVVTALGIKKAEKSLSYATQSISEDKLTGAMPTNWSAALTGKVAGLSITSPGGPVGSTRISLRGDVSLNPNGNQSLIVVDGIPISNTLTGTGPAYGAGGNSDLPIDYGNGFADINPDDIESVQVLKGANATALYGSRAANGVVLVTTKGGTRKQKGLGVTINSNTSMDDVLHWPDYQYEFGQGLPSNIGKAGTAYAGQPYYSYGAAPDGNSGTSGTSSAYGARFDPNVLYYQFDPVTQTRATEPTPWVAYKNNRKGLFQTGYTLTNSVAVEGGSKDANVRASVTHTKNEWILPNTGFERIVGSLSLSFKVSDKLRITSKGSYTNRKSDNTPAIGYNSNSIAYFMIFQNPNVDLKWLRPTWVNGQKDVKQLQPYSTFIGNPYFTLYESTNPSIKHSVTESLSATLDITKELQLMVRSGLQLSYDEREQHRPVSDVVFGKGYYKKQNVFDYEVNSDVLLSYHHNLGGSFSIAASAGGNLMRQHYNRLEASVTGLITPGVFNLANGASSPYVVSTITDKRLNSAYGTASLSWNNAVFLEATGRNDWSSTLPKKNCSFFYPSFGTSILLDKLFSLPAEVSLMKLRGSWAQVGNDTDPYKTTSYFTTSTFAGSATLPTTLANMNFKPEISTSIEAGMDLRLFGNRLGLDLSYYHNETKNQIIDAPMDPTTGFSRATINSGRVRNQGYEANLNLVPIAGKFRWNSSISWSHNENTILSLSEGMNDNQLISSIGSVSIIGKVGGTTTDLWGYKLKRNDKKEVVIAANGLPLLGSELEYVGNASPKWKAGFFNEFSYKFVKVSILVDGQYGGIVYSQAHHKMTEQGKLQHTLNGRLPGTEFYIAADDPRLAAAKLPALSGVYMVAPGVVANPDGSYSPNTKLVTVEAYNKENWRIANVENNSFDASFLKVREARIEFDLPKSILARTPLRKASLAFYGRNLYMKTSFPLFDPEAASLNGSTITPGVETGQLPTTRTFGVNLTLGL